MESYEYQIINKLIENKQAYDKITDEKYIKLVLELLINGEIIYENYDNAQWYYYLGLNQPTESTDQPTKSTDQSTESTDQPTE